MKISSKTLIRGGGIPWLLEVLRGYNVMYKYCLFTLLSLSSSCCFVAEIFATENTKNIVTDLDFKKICYDLSWRAHASCYVNNNNTNNWYQNDKYKASIYVEISKAIVDCKLKQGVFNTTKDIIEFAGTNPRSYTSANWNAVVLYNFINCKLNNKDVNIMYNKLRNMYGDKINKAISDIEQYNEALKLSEYNIKKVKNNNYTIDEACFGDTKCGIKVTKNDTTVKIFLNNYWGREVELTNDMKIKKINTLNVNPLPNFMKENPITDNKCWFNSIMINLYNSEVFQNTIEQLSEKSNVAKTVKKIFNNIKTGNMTDYVNNLNEFANTVDKNTNATIVRYIRNRQGLNVRIFYEGLMSILHAECQSNNSVDVEKGLTIIDKNIKAYDEVIYEGGSVVETSKNYDIHCNNNLYTALEKLDKSHKVDNAFNPVHEKIIIMFPKLLVFDTTPSSIKYGACIDINAFKQRNKIQYPEYIDFLDKEHVNHRYRLISCIEQSDSIDKHVISKIKLEDGTWRYINDFGTYKGVKEIKFDEMSEYRVLVFYEKQD